ncbi:MAG: 3-methyl-2-oxobutanoate dehydrogenase subunit VorB [Gemmatimonadota bacterium]|nr:3-methyl-2-oxobutanoate dehydrogenase subunit VorB [Gemmatimonadota bacterium]MDH3368799.1 3-methyl-2-oxobutanoate dehydrogenase subunit VorB [Gemmatimonadota bacterium]MDH3476717.1 3-methyl-2-oxobutanoate dehydrogenase subunit VorB [Gemmatimonadota bacterium]MDH3571486.1 3-methyl-2-oxobutanoate dehydrogenase subunit VorB [Gemmatimonadota bacterium]MDH5551120.1 3-methyl-2-oxobutanoate dehydrogenase subunit VorB [Gemmatimonadota bacterium]
MVTSNVKKVKPKPFLFPHLCKACGRCIDACPKHCIVFGTEIDPATGFTPVTVDLEVCNGCGLCITACPEPHGLLATPPELEGTDMVVSDPFTYFGERAQTRPAPAAIPDQLVPLPALQPMVVKGNHAAAIGALLAGCRHFFGYPITPSTEGAELMARLLPKLDGVFVQAVSETATVNMMYGCSGAGLRCMTFTSSPGFSLMLEGISYMVGSHIPGVFVNVMRGGPGLGNIAPEQSDIKLVCRGLGHGNTHAIVLAPSTPQEMLDLSMTAFDLAFRYRNPVIIVGDGYLGQMTGRVTLPDHLVRPGLPDWAVYGDADHRGNVITSIDLNEPDLEERNERLNAKYDRMTQHEQRADPFHCDDAEWIIVACNTPARMAKGAVRALRERGVKAGLFRPVTLWPFPIDALTPIMARAKGTVVVEAGPGQLEDELRLALSHAGLVPRGPLAHVRRLGGILPSLQHIVDTVHALAEAHHE